VQKLLGPYIDKERAQKVRAQGWLDPAVWRKR